VLRSVKNFKLRVVKIEIVFSHLLQLYDRNRTFIGFHAFYDFRRKKLCNGCIQAARCFQTLVKIFYLMLECRGIARGARVSENQARFVKYY
jgi:hypothetical protein